MMDRDKVIKGLEQFIADFKPFCGNKSDWQRVDDALALLKAQEQEIEDLKQEIEGHKDNLRETLDEMVRYADELKAQEPRVMTLEEWREWKRKPLSQRDPVYYVDNKGFGSWIAPNDQLFIYATSELGYGKLFVCWTSRPDEKRRAETPWN